MTRPTEPILTRAMVAFDVALAAAALALTVLLADRMSIWIAIPVALATLVTALVLGAFVTTWARTVAADRTATRAPRVPAPPGPLVGVRAR